MCGGTAGGCSTCVCVLLQVDTSGTLCAGLGEPRDLAQVAQLAVLGLAEEPGHLRAADVEAALAEVAGSQQTLVRFRARSPKPSSHNH